MNAIRAVCVFKHVFNLLIRVLKEVLSVLLLDGLVMKGHCFNGAFVGLKIHPVMCFK